MQLTGQIDFSEFIELMHLVGKKYSNNLPVAAVEDIESGEHVLKPPFELNANVHKMKVYADTYKVSDDGEGEEPKSVEENNKQSDLVSQWTDNEIVKL